MKALTQNEVQNLADTFRDALLGAQLQEVQANDRGLALGFHRGRSFWLILDLVPNTPMMLLFADRNPFRKAAKTKPVALFLNSHGRNLVLQGLKVQSEWGRVVSMILGSSEKQCELEIHLIPRQANLIVKAVGKQISWEKQLPLKEAPVVENPPPSRTLEEIHLQWESGQSQPKQSQLDPLAQWEKQRQKDLEKKKKALVEIQKQIDSDDDQSWRRAGELLKMQGTLDVPVELKKYIQTDESLSWNIEHCFSKAKQLAGKKVGAQERRVLLEQEIATLEKATYKPRATQKVHLVDLMHKASARGRKLQLSSGALAYCGKSAADNLALLRQAKAWDYWLHLRDFPGAHAIIHRQRHQEIPDSEIEQVSAWLARESLSSKSLILGQKLAVVLVECRFVKPIKGDRLGRVSYHSEKTFYFTLR